MKQIFKWIIGIVLLLLFGFFGAVWYLSSRWKPLLDKQIHDVVLESSKGLYKVSYDGLEFNLVTGNAYLEHFKLVPDTNVYKELELTEEAPDNLYEVAVDRLEIQNFHPKRIYSERRLNIDRILVKDPTVKIRNKHHAYHDSLPVKNEKSLYQKISKVLKELKIDQIHLEDVEVTYTSRQPTGEKTTSMKDVDIQITDLQVDSASQVDSLRFYHARSVDMNMKDYQIEMGDSLYYLQLKGIHFTSAEQTMTLDSVRLVPRYNQVDFYKQVKVAKDRFDLSFDTVQLRHIDLFKLFRQQKLYARQLLVGKSRVAIYNNKAYPKGKPTVRLGKDPHQELKRLAFPLKIDSLLLRDIDVSYHEYNPGSGQVGKVSFDHTHGLFLNVSNDPEVLSINRFMTADLHTRFMNQGKLHLQFNFDMLDPKGAFDYKGSLTGMNAVALNPLTKPLALIEVSSGYFRGLYFDVHADEHQARGNVQFYYKNLAIQVILKNGDGTNSKNSVVSVLTNKFLLNDSNPDANEQFHPGPIRYVRDPTASFFNFLWKSLFEGVKASVGIDKNRETKLMQQVKEADRAVGKVKTFFKGLFKKKGEEEK